MTRKNAKDAIVTAAISLFNTKGYNGTTIRDIAGKAKVNIANIAYYFQNKNGLLEYCLTSYYEQYMGIIEKELAHQEDGSAECLKRIAKSLLTFQSANLSLTRFVLREISIDSQIAREIMATYLTKERYYLSKLLHHGVAYNTLSKVSDHYFIIQFKSLLTMPFLNSHYLSEVLYIFPYENYFVETYYDSISSWIDSSLQKKGMSLAL